VLINRNDIDLTAPVGSFESLIAAIKAGADSVYFGVGNMNMRSCSSYNFSETDLKKIVRICKSNNKKCYLALNVVFYDEELKKMHEIVDIAADAGVNAIIASDQAAISYANSVGFEVHLSTQLNISNIESLSFYSDFADVVVLARELNLEQVKNISEQIKLKNLKGPSGNQIKIEMFSHGAICMSLSGKCYLSLHNHNRSANRGECLQDCRRSYLVSESESGALLEITNPHIMSAKDLCTIHFIDKMIDAGVRVFKIEGRARSPEYVSTVVQSYSEAINSIIEGSYTNEKKKIWQDKLSSVFNRGFWDGYYLGQKMGEWSDSYGSKASKRKKYIAKNINYFNKIKVAEFLCEADQLRKGDNIIITGPNTGVIEYIIEELRTDKGNVDEIKKGEIFSIPVDQKIRKADKLYRIEDRNK